jgi:serine/threonine protein kinase
MIVGSGKKGEVFKYEDEKYGTVVMKRYKQGTIYSDMYYRIQKEIKILLKLKKLHEAGIFPGEIYALKTNISPAHEYDKDYIKNKNPYIIMKYYETTLLQFMTQFHAKWIYKSIIFQIIAQLYSIHKYLCIYHRDLHSENILLTRCATKNIITYNINGIVYVVPTYGYKVAIIDFDSSNEKTDKPELDKIETLWHNIIYGHVMPDINNNKYIVNAIALLQKNEDMGDISYKKIWGWYDKTGKVDRKLFKHLLSSGFEYNGILDTKFASLVKYIISLLHKANIKTEIIDITKINLEAFGYSHEHSGKIDYRI